MDGSSAMDWRGQSPPQGAGDTIMASDKASDWRTTDIDSEISQEARELFLASKAAYNAYRETPEYKAYAAAKAEFETWMQDEFAEQLPIGSELAFGYSFGKLSLKVVKAKKAKTKSNGSLLDFLNGAQASGRAA
jgi:hypothetical protein